MELNNRHTCYFRYMGLVNKSNYNKVEKRLKAISNFPNDSLQ